MSPGLEPLGRKLLGSVGRRLPAVRGGVTVLAYHLVDGATASPVDIPIDRFERQLDSLAELGTVVPLADALRSLDRAGDRDVHRIVLTFDDAFRNFGEVVWPRLESRSLPATLYVPVGFLDGTSSSPLTGAETLPPLSWTELRELAESDNLDVGSHSMSHPDLRKLTSAECKDELRISRERLEAVVERPVRSFCYPKALWNPAVRSQVAREYESAVVAGGHRNRSVRFHPHSIGRLPIRRSLPEPLTSVIDKGVWPEEWFADRWRRLR